MREIRIQKLSTKETFRFDSLRQASIFLGRGSNYVADKLIKNSNLLSDYEEKLYKIIGVSRNGDFL